MSLGQTKSYDHKEVLLLMGSRFEIKAVAVTKEIAKYAVDQGIREIQRIETLISSWDSSSQTSHINRMSGIEAVKVDKELFELVRRSLKVSGITDGAFDISIAGLEKIYRFDKQECTLPSDTKLKASLFNVGYKNIVLQEEDQTIYLKEKGSRIGFGGIGKGYAANRAKLIMQKIQGVKGGLVNAAGDLVAWGENGKALGWRIQVADPTNAEQSKGWLNIQDLSIVTSGDYERYFTSSGKRYSHIINPKTGLPTTGIKSVSIICPDAELGDALATSVFVMGTEKGLAFINTLKNVEGLIIDDNEELIYSKGLTINKY